ncbi:hypothetical protein [Acinetobacter indicus]|uniref:hypothetical protein n=1 Tax=Acinetobacter indicus TaxID=756892 RepID=UPI00257627F9|nr:hypothetical protein [Acinetobacter indicus]MDM1330021.1 hypothetical protein [Acinetobacter indicus]
MAARKVNTPGATEKAPEPVSTAEQAEAALEHITGNDPEPEAPQDQSTNKTSSLGALVEDERLDQVLENQKRIEGKLDQLLKAGGIEAPKKKRWVQGKNGYEQKEV